MYVRTPRALVWIESPQEQPRPTPKVTPNASTPYWERWAKKPLKTAKGRCVAVRQSGGKLEVACVCNNHLIWRTAPGQLLSAWQLEKWLREGF